MRTELKLESQYFAILYALHYLKINKNAQFFVANTPEYCEIYPNLLVRNREAYIFWF